MALVVHHAHDAFDVFRALAHLLGYPLQWIAELLVFEHRVGHEGLGPVLRRGEHDL